MVVVASQKPGEEGMTKMALVERSRSRNGAMERGALLLGIILPTVMITMTQPCVWAEEEAEAEKANNLALIEMKVQNLYPEGFDWDAQHSRFLVGSMGLARLVSVTEDGVVEEFVKDETYAGAIILGVRVDLAYNRVLAVVHKATEPRMAALAAYDLDSKKRTLFVNLLEGEDALSKKVVPNDVAVSDDGTAYVTNSAGNSIWRVTLKGVKSVFVAAVPQQPFAVEDEFVKSCSTNGIVHHGGYLLVGQSNSGAIFRVRLADKEVQMVKVKDAVVLPGADGMALRSDGTLVVVSLAKAWLLSSTDAWETATLIDTVPLDADDATSSVSINELRVFAIHSHFPKFFSGATRETFNIVEMKFPLGDEEHNNPLWLLAVFGIFAVVVIGWKFQMNQFNKEYTRKRV